MRWLGAVIPVMLAAGCAGRAAPANVPPKPPVLPGTPAGTALLQADRADRDAWLHATMRENLTDLEFDLLMLVAPVLRKLAYSDATAGTLGS